jgi:hypothetical protein
MYFYLNINDHENDLNKHFYFNWSYSNSQHTLVESYFYIATGRLFPPGTPVSSYFYIATSRWFSPGTPVSSTITTEKKNKTKATECRTKSSEKPYYI